MTEAFDWAEFADLGKALNMVARLRSAGVDNLVWIMPLSLLAGATSAYGIPVIRADVPEPMLAVKP